MINRVVSSTGDGKCVICDSYVRPCTVIKTLSDSKVYTCLLVMWLCSWFVFVTSVTTVRIKEDVQYVEDLESLMLTTVKNVQYRKRM